MPRWICLASAVLLGLVAVATASFATAAEKPAEKPSAFCLGGRHPTPALNVVVVTGGHPFNHVEFFELFEGQNDIAYDHVNQKVGDELFENVDRQRWPYDVIVLYNFAHQITPKQQENFVWLLNHGVGLVILHHANDAYVSWPLYAEISGVQSHFAPWQQDGKTMAPSDFSRGLVHFKVHVADPNHPITKGLKDYDAADETYCRRSFSPDNHLLLTADAPSSDRAIAWTRMFHDRARIFYIQSGHGERMYQNPTYREIVHRTIRWTGGRL